MIFAFEFKEKLKKKGITVHNDQQLREMASPVWSNMSSDEKEEYKRRARLNPTLNSNKTLNSRVYRDASQDAEKYNAMVAEIRELVSHNTSKIVHDMISTEFSLFQSYVALDEQVFHFINATAFIEIEDESYPAELALAKFSLKKGISEVFHIRINPGELPLGSAFEASKYSKDYHNYPLPPDCEGEKDYMAILEKFIQFIHPMAKLPIFFSEGNTRESPIPWRKTRKVLEKIFYHSLEDDLIDDIKVYPLEELLFVLNRITTLTNKITPFPSIVSAAEQLNQDCFEYSTAGCDFHESIDKSANCSLSKVRRAGYIFAKYCCNPEKYPAVEGAHFPIGYTPIK